MHKYKNVSGSAQTIIAEGDIQPRRVPAGGEVVSSVPIENPNFKYAGEAEQQPGAVVGTQIQQPNAVTDATGVDKLPQEGQQ